jgi:hypothetical protein
MMLDIVTEWKINSGSSDFLPERMEIHKLVARKNNPALWTYERLKDYIQKFEEGLDSEQEVGLKLVSSGSNSTFHIQNVGYYGPDIICFYCHNPETKSNAQLIQNITQLNVLLIPVPKLEEKPKRVGFNVVEDE